MAGQGPAKRRHVAVAPSQQEDNMNRSTNGGTTTTATAYTGPVVSDGARLSYAALKQASIPPQAPVNSVPLLAPVIYTAICNPTLQQARLVLSPGCEGEEVPPIFVMRQPHTVDISSSSSTTATTTATIERAYAILPHKKHIPLKHGDPNFSREWGRLYYGIAYQRDHAKHDDDSAGETSVTFRVPNLDDEAVLTSATPDDPIFVAIKMIDKRAVAHALGGVGNAPILQENVHGENPYKEIARMQEIGDNKHVIKCLDALQDENYLYIITPWALGGDLKDLIWNNNPMIGHFDATGTLWTPTAAAGSSSAAAAAAAAALSPSSAIGTYFCQIIDIVAYLERFNIHHRDLSPDNFLFLDQKQTILVAMDLAMSVRIPTINITTATTESLKSSNQSQEEKEEPQSLQQRQQRTLIAPIGRFGTVGWMAPEIYWDFAFDGVGCDLWSAMLILYNLLTRQILYQYPHPADISFRYFVHAGGLTYNSINERTIQIQMEVFNDDDNDAADNNNMDAATFAQRKLNQRTLLTKAQAHVEFSRDIRELFHHFFRAPPTERWTLAQVMESSYVQKHRLRQQQHPQEQPQGGYPEHHHHHHHR